MTPKKISDMLQFRLSNKTFDDQDYSLKASSYEGLKQSTDFHTDVINSINNGDPVLMAGNTRYKDGGSAERQHWYVIIGYKDADGKGSTINDVDGYYIHDPAVGAGLSTVKDLGSKGKFVSHLSTMKHLAASKRDEVYAIFRK